MTVAQFLIGYLFLLTFLVAPIASMMVEAFLYHGNFSLEWFLNIITSSEYVSFLSRGGRLFEVRRGIMILWGHDYGILLNSLYVAFNVTIVCAIIGVVLALIMARYDFKAKRIFQVFLVLQISV